MHKTPSADSISLLTSSSSEDLRTGSQNSRFESLDQLFNKIDINKELDDILHLKPRTNGTLIDLEESQAQPVDSSTRERIILREFNESDSDENIIADQSGRILAIKTSKLIVKLTSDVSSSALRENFFLTYRLFMSLEEFIEMLAIRMRQAFISDCPDNQEIKIALLRLFKYWTVEFYEIDFAGKDTYKRLNQALNRIWEDALVLTLSDKQLLINLGKLIKKEYLEGESISLRTEEKKRKGWWTRTLRFAFAENLEDKEELQDDYEVLLMERSSTIAEQLCMIERRMYLSIDWLDLVNIPKTESEDIGNSSVQRASRHFNRMCEWFVEQILKTEQTNNERASKIRKLIRTSRKCLQLANYSSALQIILALQNYAVVELKDAWSRVKQTEMEYLNELCAFASPLKNFKNIRKALKIVESDETMPCCPFIGIFVSDLNACREAPNDYPSHLIPWHQYSAIAGILKQFRGLQSPARSYDFEATNLGRFFERLSSKT